MVNLISILQYDKGMAFYQIQSTRDNNYAARLIKTTSKHKLPEQILIDSSLGVKKGGTSMDAITNKLICVIKTFGSLDNNISSNQLS